MHSIIDFILANDFQMSRNTAMQFQDDSYKSIVDMLKACKGEAAESGSHLRVMFKNPENRTVGMLTITSASINILYRENEIYIRAIVQNANPYHNEIHKRVMGMIGEMAEEKRRAADGIFESIKNQDISSTFKPTSVENVHINDKDVNSAYWNRMEPIKFDDKITEVCMSARDSNSVDWFDSCKP